MVKLTSEQKIHNYAAKLAFCKTNPAIEYRVENKIDIGKYGISRLVRKETGKEDNHHYFFDTKGIPHLICTTYAGAQNGESTTPKQKMVENQSMLLEVKAALLYINEPKLFKIKDSTIKKMLNECAENEDFSTLHI
ncbi:MAG: hypothetical protein J6X00_00780, partial [Clostridia bacterium]|nr:hypothetical protein [Clostridia bacterium]